MIGKTVSHYRILAQLGSGGMGVVYGGQDTRLGRAVALKFVPEELAKDPIAIDRLNSEARTASGLNHPNICTVYDVGEHDGRPFIVMEQLKGQTLRERLGVSHLNIHDTIDIGIQVADALDAAHRHGIVHRDIKPANIFLVERGAAKVLDFGLAKLLPHYAASATTAGPTIDRTAEGMTVGTISYMSPEQVSGDPLDGRTDLFSLGVVLYECVTGRQPFTGKTSAVIFSAILTRQVVAPVVFNPNVPPQLQDVINKCLEKDRELRYQEAAGLRADLKRVRRDLESGHSAAFTAPLPGAESRVDVSSHVGVPARASWKPAASAAAAIALAAGLAAYVLSTRQPTPPPATATTVDPTVRTQLGLASASLEAKDFRGALAYADQVLRVEPGNGDALRIRDTARDSMKRLNDALARAAERLAAGDKAGAGAALGEARAISPALPAITDFAARLGESSRPAAEPSRRATTITPPTAPPAAAAKPPVAVPVPSPAAEAPPAAAPAPSPAGASTPPTPATTDIPLPPPSPPAAAPAPPQIVARTPEPSAPAAVTPAEPAPARPAESDEAIIRRVIATYARAIETKDLPLFRSVKPNLSADEQHRIEEGFRAVTSQRVALTVTSVDIRGQQATARVRRRDTIQAAGREQTVDSVQTIALARGAGDWTIQDIR